MRKYIFLTVLSILFFSESTKAQCQYNALGYYMSLSAPTTIGGIASDNCIYGGEYITCTGLVAGNTYRVSTVGNTAFDTQISIFRNTTTVAANDDAPTGGSQSEIYFTPTTNGDHDIQINEFLCQSNSICMTLEIELVAQPLPVITIPVVVHVIHYGESIGVGRNISDLQIQEQIEKLSNSESRIFINGPTGSGKELIARKIHKNSNRKKGPFVVLNGALLDVKKYELELFGEEKDNGSITYGSLEKATSGILLIDEVTEIPLETQSKILRVLIDQKFRRINGNHDIKVDVRIICSTSKNIYEEIKYGNFREDLFHRLNVFNIEIKPLSKRPDDIPLLIEYLANLACNPSSSIDPTTHFRPSPSSHDRVIVPTCMSGWCSIRIGIPDRSMSLLSSRVNANVGSFASGCVSVGLNILPMKYFGMFKE